MTEPTASGASPDVVTSTTNSPAVPLFPSSTGDPVIDAGLHRLRESRNADSLDAEIEAGQDLHRVLQERLADLGGS